MWVTLKKKKTKWVKISYVKSIIIFLLKSIANKIISYINTVGPKDLGAPAHFNIKPKAQAEEENVQGWLRKAQSC